MKNKIIEILFKCSKTKPCLFYAYKNRTRAFYLFHFLSLQIGSRRNETFFNLLFDLLFGIENGKLYIKMVV